ncbi:D-sedoheptulose 7-phosphate isomerase [Candidatus Kaiserbacteria bacterium]|nr:D-sedoheptulose 7-phosphate isomerase [Candidatus Kaiserbacteria bacterium]
MKKIILTRIKEHQATVRLLVGQATVIEKIARIFIKSLKNGGKILLCGNGGSAADAQHVAAELVGRFKKERRAWPAIALVSNPSTVTAIGNDYGFEYVFLRQVEALAKKGDVVVGISTSGNSKNVLNAMSEAKKVGCATIGATGKNGGELAKIADVCFRASSDNTPRVQEAHILMWHIVCELVELKLAK